MSEEATRYPHAIIDPEYPNNFHHEYPEYPHESKYDQHSTTPSYPHKQVIYDYQTTPDYYTYVKEMNMLSLVQS